MSEGFDGGFGGDVDTDADTGTDQDVQGVVGGGAFVFADLDNEPDDGSGAQTQQVNMEADANANQVDMEADANANQVNMEADANANQFDMRTDFAADQGDTTGPAPDVIADAFDMEADAANGQYDIRGDFAPEGGNDASGGGVRGGADVDLPRVVTSDGDNLAVRWGDTYYQLTGGEVIEIREPSDQEVDTAPSSYLSTIKQSLDFVRLAAARIQYAISADQAAQGIKQLSATRAATPQQAEERAITARRALETWTRANMPGDLAEGVNKLAAERNRSRYGDPLGWRDPEHVRSLRPQATTESIVSGSGRTHRGATAAGVAGGVVGGISGFAGAMGLGDDFNNAIEGRVQVDLQDLRAGDFPVGYEIKGVELGREGGYVVVGTIRVERNVVGRKRFYVVRAGRGI